MCPSICTDSVSGKLLPVVCGVPSLQFGSAVERGFRRVLLVFDAVDCRWCNTGLYRFERLCQFKLPYQRLHVALCPRTCTNLFPDSFFPSAGFRDRVTGARGIVGTDGDIWSSVVSGVHGYRLIFCGATVCGAGTDRTYAFNLRCVQVFTSSVSRRVSSRLRGIVAALRVNCRVSVRAVTLGLG